MSEIDRIFRYPDVTGQGGLGFFRPPLPEFEKVVEKSRSRLRLFSTGFGCFRPASAFSTIFFHGAARWEFRMCKFRKIQEKFNNKNLEKFRKIQKNLEMRPAGSGEMQREFGNALAGSGKLQRNFRDATGRFRQNSYKFRNAPAGSGKSQRNSFDLSRRVPN